MSRFSEEELRQRSFERAAYVLRHFWEEQQDDPDRNARVSTRIFDHLVYEKYISLGKSAKGTGRIEHLVPCALLRDRAFEMYWAGKTVKDVAEMLGRFLRVAHITPAEADILDHDLGHKTTMPADWNWETGLVTARLDAANIRLLYV